MDAIEFERFGSWVVGQRARKGVTQVSVANAAGCSKGHLSRIESGQVPPSADLMLRIAKALGRRSLVLKVQ